MFVYLAIAISAGFYFYFLFNVFLHIALVWARNWNLKNPYDVAVKSVSAVQAVQATIAGAVIWEGTRENILYARHWLTNFYGVFALVYLYYDVWAMYQAYLYTVKMNTKDGLFPNGSKTDQYTTKSDSNLVEHNAFSIQPETESLAAAIGKQSSFSRFFWKNPSILLHHLFLPLFYAPVVFIWRGGLGDFFIATFLLTEAPVPLLSIRSFLIQLNLRNSIFYVINGLCLLVTYFVFRVLTLPYLFWRYAQFSEQSVFTVPMSIPMMCTLGSLVIFLLNTFWWLRMVKIALNLCFGRGGSSFQRR